MKKKKIVVGIIGLILLISMSAISTAEKQEKKEIFTESEVDNPDIETLASYPYWVRLTGWVSFKSDGVSFGDGGLFFAKNVRVTGHASNIRVRRGLEVDTYSGSLTIRVDRIYGLLPFDFDGVNDANSARFHGYAQGVRIS